MAKDSSVNVAKAAEAAGKEENNEAATSELKDAVTVVVHPLVLLSVSVFFLKITNRFLFS